MKIAILGWGSLVWDPGSLSQLCGHFFKQGGPTLRIEFSRVSKDGRLTLVIDRENGADAPTRVAASTRSTLEDAVTDLWIRETRFSGERSEAEKNSKDGSIGYADLAGKNASINLPADEIHPEHQYAYNLITPWLKTSGFDAVVWTALRSNFKRETTRDFSVEEAINYLKTLTPRSQQDAYEYISRAPEEVETPLRKRLRDLGLIRRMPIPNDIIGDRNVKEALEFLKDWVTALMTITTAAIGVFAAFLPNLRHYHHWQRWLLGLTLLCLGLTVFFGCHVLYMLPGCAQRTPFPTEDIYSLHNLRQTLGSWVKRFWYAFLASVLSILTFYASTMGFDFLWLAILADLIVLATIVVPKFPDWFNKRHFLVRWFLLSVGWLVLVIGIAWAFGALWFDFPVAALRRPLVAAVFGLGAIAALLFVRPQWRAWLGVIGAITLVAAWWVTIRPSNTRDWQPEVAQAPYAEIDPDRVVIHNFRNFHYTTKTDFLPRWETKTVHLSNLRTVYFFTNYWGSTLICHTFVSFDFGPEGYVCISIETRMAKGQAYSALAGLYRQFELYYVIGDERDIVRLRTNYRLEDVYLYHLIPATPERSRALFLDYLQSANELHERAQWYNELLSNCTSNVRLHAKHIGSAYPWDWQLLVNGSIDEHAYDLGAIDRSMPFAELKRLSHINDRARKADDDPTFSSLIRKGLPGIP